jgi:MGT family glycosyltransferase
VPTAIFYNIPASGHVNPTLPVVTELVRAGEEVVYYASAGYRRAVEATGARFRAYPDLPDDYFPAFDLDGTNPGRTAAVLAGTARTLVPGLVEEAAEIRPDYVMLDSMCCWGWLVAQTLNVPTLVSSTFLLLTLPVVVREPTLARVLLSLVRGLGQVPEFRRVWRPLALRYGVRPLRLDQMFAVPGDMTISYTSSIFQPGADRFGRRVSFVGPSVAPRADQPAFPFEWLDGRPLVYASLGTVNNAKPAFFRTCIEAFPNGTCQLVLSIGSRLDPQALGRLPDHILVRPVVPQLELLARAALFITHGGMNSVQEALLHGVPVIAVPQQPEQACVARQLVRLQAGAMLPSRRLSADRLRALAGRMLDDRRVRQGAASVGESLRAAGGHRRAAAEILALVRGSASRA